MAMNYITDDEIDKILGKIGEFKSEPIRPAGAYRSSLKNEPKKQVSKVHSSVSVSQTTQPSPKPKQDFTFSYLLDDETQKNLYSQTINTNAIKSISLLKKADFVRKTYAFIADMCLMCLVMIGFIYGSILAFGYNSFIFSQLNLAERLNSYGVPDIALWFAGLYAVLFFFYMVYFESLLGQTLGKIIMNIKIVDEANEKPGVAALVFRSLLFFILPLGLLGLHNKITNTRLVKGA